MAAQMRDTLAKIGLKEGSNYMCMTKAAKEKFEKEDHGGYVSESEGGVTFQQYCANAIKTGVVAGVLATATIAVNI